MGKDRARKRARVEICGQLRLLDDEAFSWLAVALQAHAMTKGAGLQIWPDGLGGFQRRARIEAIRAAADRYLRAME
jgi:hypothetical protein